MCEEVGLFAIYFQSKIYPDKSVNVLSGNWQPLGAARADCIEMCKCVEFAHYYRQGAFGCCHDMSLALLLNLRSVENSQDSVFNQLVVVIVMRRYTARISRTRDSRKFPLFSSRFRLYPYRILIFRLFLTRYQAIRRFQNCSLSGNEERVVSQRAACVLSMRFAVAINHNSCQLRQTESHYLQMA